MPTGRKPRPPATAREIAAYRCGERLAGFGEPEPARIMAHGRVPWSWMTKGELDACALTRPTTWSRFWWQGWHDARGMNR